jgi:predicted ATPase
MDFGAASLGWAAFASWLLGYPDKALKLGREALDLAREMNHPNTLGISLNVMGLVCHKRRDVQLVKEYAESVLQLSTEAGLVYWQAWEVFLQGCIETEQGKAEQGVSRIQQSVSAMESKGYYFHHSMMLASLAEAYLKSGHLEEGLAVVKEALSFVEKSNERYHEAELYRLEGHLRLLGGESETEAETSFHRAIEIARRQSAKSWELRAMTSLAHLWQKQGKKAEARTRLAEIYDWFTEGFDTQDLKDAKTLLEELH